MTRIARMKTMSKEEIINRIQSLLEELQGMGVRGISLFGSVSREEKSPHDVDILLEVATNVGLVQFVNIKTRFEEILKMPVDIITRKACKPDFYKLIEKDLEHVA